MMNHRTKKKNTVVTVTAMSCAETSPCGNGMNQSSTLRVEPRPKGKDTTNIVRFKHFLNKIIDILVIANCKMRKIKNQFRYTKTRRAQRSHC